MLAADSICAALPTGRCLATANCSNIDLECGLTSRTDLYVCNDRAVDVTRNALGTCVDTPCKVCQLCLSEWSPFVKSNASQSDRYAVAAELKKQCLLRVGLSNNKKRTVENCEAAFNATWASVNGTAGKRAAVICRNLGECVAANLGAGCKLASTSTAVVPAVPEGSLNYCTPHGTNGSSTEFTTGRVLGIEPALDFTTQRPAAGLCHQDGASWHCNNTAGAAPGDYVCRLPGMGEQGPTRITCDPADGADIETPLGTCKRTPCKACQDCYTVMSAFATSQLTVIDPVVMAADFKKECEKWINPVDCSVVAAQVQASFQGNLGKRPVAICKALKTCNSTETGACVLRANLTAAEVAVTAENADSCTINSMSVYEGGSLPADAANVVDWAAYNGKSRAAGGKLLLSLNYKTLCVGLSQLESARLLVRNCIPTFEVNIAHC